MGSRVKRYRWNRSLESHSGLTHRQFAESLWRCDQNVALRAFHDLLHTYVGIQALSALLATIKYLYSSFSFDVVASKWRYACPHIMCVQKFSIFISFVMTDQ